MNNCIFTGCDIVSAFSRKGKKEHVKPTTFVIVISEINHSQCQALISENDFQNLLRHVMLVYNTISAVTIRSPLCLYTIGSVTTLWYKSKRERERTRVALIFPPLK